MTAQSHSASIGVPRRPTPPRPAAPRFDGLPVTYVPDVYDPRQAPAAVAATAGQFGVVYPKARTGRGVWVMLLAIVTATISFVGWRATQNGASAAPGLAYTSSAGHFSVRFPSQPTEISRTVRQGPMRMSVTFAVVVHEGLVGSVEVTGPLTGNTDALDERMAASLGTNGGHIDLSSEKRLKFHGMPARQGNFFDPNTGDLMTLLMIKGSERHLYLIMALTGPTFDALKDSFTVTK